MVQGERGPTSADVIHAWEALTRRKGRGQVVARSPKQWFRVLQIHGEENSRTKHSTFSCVIVQPFRVSVWLRPCIFIRILQKSTFYIIQISYFVRALLGVHDRRCRLSAWPEPFACNANPFEDAVYGEESQIE
jgi:hypothetical protein